MIDAGLLGWEGYRESRRCSRETYPESLITKNTSIRILLMVVVAGGRFSLRSNLGNLGSQASHFTLQSSGPCTFHRLPEISSCIDLRALGLEMNYCGGGKRALFALDDLW